MTKSIKKKNILPTILLIIGIVLPFWSILYGINFTDEPYHIMNAIDYKTNPIALLSYFMANIWGKVCGFSIFSLRVFAAIISILTLSISIIYFYKKTKKTSTSFIVFGILSFLFCLKQYYIFGWDAISDLFLICTTICYLLYSQKKQYTYLFLLSITSSFLFLSRFPNIVIVPIICFMLFLHFWRKEEKKNRISFAIFLYLVSFSFCTILIIWLIYGDFFIYIQHLKKIESINGHNLSFLVERYFGSILECLKMIGLLLSILLGFYFINIIPLQNKVKCFLKAICLFPFGLYIFLQNQEYNFLLSYLFTAFLVAAILYIIINQYLDQRHIEFFTINMSIALLLFAVIPISGSNTGLYKVMNIYFYPILLCYLPPLKSQTVKQTVVGVFIILLIYFPYNKTKFLYEDAGITDTSACTKLPGITNIYTTPMRAQYLNNVYQDAKTMIQKGNQVLFVGSSRLIFEYMLSCRAQYATLNFWVDLNDEDYVLKTKIFLLSKNNISVFVVPEYPEQINPDEEESLMEQMLKSYKYKAIKTNSFYKIYSSQ